MTGVFISSRQVFFVRGPPGRFHLRYKKRIGLAMKRQGNDEFRSFVHSDTSPPNGRNRHFRPIKFAPFFDVLP
ncbi:hypothetical protein [Ottowia massiliensis]|uniref:hypothetical protein n=1 Tax=Ottowia massiliensis TaxID=2045302 RepID=UPI0011AF10D2|nr:hypothetical protein [Ottowia massiliensis]